MYMIRGHPLMTSTKNLPSFRPTHFPGPQPSCLLVSFTSFVENQLKEINHRKRMYVLLLFLDVHTCQFSPTPNPSPLKHPHPSAMLTRSFNCTPSVWKS